MTRTILVGAGLVIACALVQSTWLHAIEILGVIPDLSLLVLIYISFKNTGPEGQAVGFISGLIQDFISVAPLGLSAFVKTLVGFAFGSIAGNFFVGRLLLPMVFGAGGTIIKGMGIGVLSLIFPKHIHSYNFLERSFWLELGYNAILAPILFFLLGLTGKLLLTTRNRE